MAYRSRIGPKRSAGRLPLSKSAVIAVVVAGLPLVKRRRSGYKVKARLGSSYSALSETGSGQTLPLVSMGGSSILFASMATGMILSVSWGCRETPGGENITDAADEKGEDLTDTAVTAEGKAAGAPVPETEMGNKRTEFEFNG